MDNLQVLIDEIMHLKEASILLEKVFEEIGPYRNGEVTPETWNEVRNYFKFNDSK